MGPVAACATACSARCSARQGYARRLVRRCDPARRALIAVAVVAASCTASQGPSFAPPPWQPSGGFGPGVFITRVLADPWVAVGWSDGSDGLPATACFVSTDGRAWTGCPLVPVDTDGRHTRLLSVARVGSTIVAGGVAVGALHGNPRPYLWAGQSGGPLRELNLPRELFGGERIISFSDLAAAARGGFAAGTWDGVTNQSVAQVWRTTDGTDWQRLDAIAALTSTPDEILRGDAVTVGPNRVVLAGAAFSVRQPSNRDDGAIWWSDDGISWTRADTAGADLGGAGDQELRTAAAIGHGFLVAGSTAAAASIWSSPDGRQWRRALPLPGGTAGTKGPVATVTALATGDSGQEWAGGIVNGSARLWASGDGHRWVAVPLPRTLAEAGPAQVVTLATSADQLLVAVQGSRGSVATTVGDAGPALNRWAVAFDEPTDRAKPYIETSLNTAPFGSAAVAKRP